MPIGFSSPARNLFLLGGSGEGIVTNFFRAIARNNNEHTIQVTSNQYVDSTKTYYTGGDNRYLSTAPVGSANRRYGFVEERDIDGLLGNKVEVAPTTTNTDLDLTDFIVDSSDNIVACGFTPDTGWISKYDSNGAVVWSSTSNTGDAKYRAVAEASDGSYYICGTIQGDFENDEVNTRSIIEKFDSDGNPLWGKQISITDGFVIARGIALNSNDEIYVCGYVEDDTIKASLVKLSATGEIIWDRTFESHDPGVGVLGGYKAAGFYDITIDGKDQIFLVGSLLGTGAVEDGIIVKLNPQGNIEWQKQTTGEDVRYQRVKSDSETGQSVVTGIIQHDTLGECGIVTKYSGNGTVVFRRILRASEANSPTNAFDKMALDADPSYYYLAFTDRGYSSSGAPDNDRYIYGRVSTSGNGLGDFEYEFDGTNRTIDYVIDTFADRIGRLDDGSVRNDTSDLVTYPFGANDLVFDDYATSISNKKAQISEPNIYAYSGSPSVRPVDLQELNLLGDTGRTEAVAGTYNNIDPSNSQPYSMGTQRENDFRSQVVVSSLTGFTRIDIATSYGWSGSNGGSLSQSTYLRNSSNTIISSSSGGGLSGNYSFSVTGLNPNETYNIYHTSTSSGSSGFAEINASGTIVWDGYQTLAGTDGAWLDQSGKGNNAAVLSPQPGASGPIANGAGYWEFNGTDDAMSINSLPDFENITVEWWGTSNQPDANYRAPIMKTTNTGWQDGFGFYQQGSVLSWWVNTWNGGGVTETQSTTQAFGWTHWVGTYDGSDVKLYRNGVLEHSVSFADPLTNPNVSVDIGHSKDNYHWDGNIGEVRIYPTALTPAQVFQNYNATKTKYTNEAPDTAPKIGPGIVYGSNLLLNYDFGNRATYDRTNQNLVPYSQGDNWVSNWTNVGATILSTTERSPVGTNDAVKYTGTGFVTNVSMTSGKTYVWSLYVKVVDAADDTIKVGHGASQYGSSGNFTANITYNLSDWSKQYSEVFDNAYIYDVVSVGDGWYRIGGKAYKGDANQGQFEIYIGNNNATVMIWGPQLEEWEGIGAFDSLPPKASRYFGTTGTIVNNVSTTVKNLASSSYTNTLPTEWVFDTNSFQANTGVLVCDPVILHQTSNTTGYAWEAWVKINSFGLASEAYVFRAYPSGGSITAGAYIVQGGGSLQGKLFLQASNNTASGPNNLAMPDGISEGVWSHFVVTGTHNGVYYQYYNGNAVGAYAPNANFAPQQLARIGSGGSTDMSFGEVRCYDRELTAAEVSQNFNATRAKYGV